MGIELSLDLNQSIRWQRKNTPAICKTTVSTLSFKKKNDIGSTVRPKY